MAKKVTPVSETAAAAIPPRTRKTTIIQPDLAVEIENCKKRVTSLKALNKLMPVIDSMDKDSLAQLKKLIDAKLEPAE